MDPFSSGGNGNTSSKGSPKTPSIISSRSSSVVQPSLRRYHSQYPSEEGYWGSGMRYSKEGMTIVWLGGVVQMRGW